MKEYNDRKQITKGPVLSSLSVSALSMLRLFLHPEDGGRMFLRNADNDLSVIFTEILGHEKEKCWVSEEERGKEDRKRERGSKWPIEFATGLESTELGRGGGQ
jgi:hypothetical protein